MQVIITKTRKKIFEVSSTGVKEVAERTILDAGDGTLRVDEIIDGGDGTNEADYQIDSGH